MANTYALRVDGQDSAPLVSVCKKYGGAYFVVRELEHSNPHFHAVLHTDAKISVVRQALKRALPAGGNGAYSCTLVRELDRYQQYLCKGDSSDQLPEVVDAEGWNYQKPEWWQERHAAYWAENAATGVKRRAAPIGEVVLLACKEQRVEWTSRSTIAELYIREMVARNKPISLFSAKAQVNLLQIKLCPDDRAIEELAQQI